MKKKAVSYLLICALVFSFCALNYSPLRLFDNSDNFRNKLVEIYQKYDFDNKSDSEFASARLMLSDYKSNKTYGASDYAFDKKHSFAVLQYNSEEEALDAYDLIKKDGISVEADGKSTLDTASSGTVFPAASNALGTPSFISNFNMNKDDVIVAVIDTGVMYDHELMANRFVSRGYDFSDDARSNAYYNTAMSDSYYSHGTFVCGIIADNTPENVKILPYKAVPFGASEASDSAIVAAIYDAVDKGASVINVSMSTSGGASAFKYAVQTALNKNVCVCASAGNNAKEIKYRYPAATPGVITATALESDMQTFASFSNYGTAVDFCAPGRGIVSAVPYKSGENKYGTNSGTSFSAPYITALCADVKSLKNTLSKDDVCTVLKEFSVDLGQEGYDVYYGYGLPVLSNMVYTDDESYTCKIPQGTLQVYENLGDFTKSTQPWRLFADRLLSVDIDENVSSIGAYAFNNMKIADFNMPQRFTNVGDYAFYSCNTIESFEFDENVVNIGEGAFGGLDEDFYISGYRNTAAEVYTQREGICFNPLGCKHNYYADVVDPTDDEAGYTVYTCTACGDTYYGEYIEPPEYFEGECGMGVYWRFYTREKSLEIGGNGYMYTYSSENEIPWNVFMKKIKTVSIGEGVTSISDYILCNASSAQSLVINTKSAGFGDKTIVFDEESNLVIYAYDDSSAKDYFDENGVQYVSLGCAHSRYLDYSEELPSCCYDTYGVYTCRDCKAVYKEYLSKENKGHYFSGRIDTLDVNSITDAEVYLDGKLSAITNSKGKYIIYPVLCGNHFVEIKKHGRVIDSFEITVDGSNIRNKTECCYGDFDNNGFINAKDFAYALKNDFEDSNILDYGRVQENSEAAQIYDNQELPYCLKISNEPNDINENKRDFIAVIENNSEFEIKESGFVYGKNMSEDMLYLENEGEVNGYGYSVKVVTASDNTVYNKSLTYGSSDNKGVLSARFYIIYTNGISDYTCYSEVSSYEYSSVIL